MKLSKETIELLKNFSKFESGIIIQAGNTLKIRTAEVYAQATVEETFPSEARIEDIRHFLTTVALFRDPEIEFREDHILIAEADGGAELVYPQAKRGSAVFLPLPKNLKPIPPENFTFVISAEQLATLQRALGVLGQKNRNDWQTRNLTITSDGNTIRLVADREFSLAGYSMTTEIPSKGVEFQCVLDSADLLMAPGPYQVTVTPTYTIFQHAGGYSLRYFVGSNVALSTWGEKKTYVVLATKSTVQDCQCHVLAHSAEEAKAIVRRKPSDDLRWTVEPSIHTEFTVVA